jgi:hypothetical protein
MTVKHKRRDRTVHLRHKDTGLAYHATQANRRDRRTKIVVPPDDENTDWAIDDISIFEYDLLMQEEWAEELREWEAMINAYSYSDSWVTYADAPGLL